MVVPLDDLNEDGGPVLEGLGEDLQQVPVVVVVDEDPQLLEGVDVLLDLHRRRLQPLAQLSVVGVRDVEELGAPVSKVLDALDDVVRPEGNVLHSGCPVVVDVLLDLQGHIFFSNFIHAKILGEIATQCFAAISPKKDCSRNK